jgi:hypothetical protein
MNIKQLVAHAFEDARIEFQAILESKLEALVGTDDDGLAVPPSKGGCVSRTRARTTADEVAALAEGIVRVVGGGVALSRGEIAEVLGVAPDRYGVLGVALGKLRDAGTIVMTGNRRCARYALASSPTTETPDANAPELVFAAAE